MIGYYGFSNFDSDIYYIELIKDKSDEENI